MKDILYKTTECQKRYGVFGIEPLTWYNAFFTLRRFATTRLQFDKSVNDKDIKLSNYTVKEGDLIFNCHIPSSGPLTYDLRLKSYKELYEFYKDELKDGILIIHCDSWILYPKYIEKVYKKTSNITDFSKDLKCTVHGNMKDLLIVGGYSTRILMVIHLFYHKKQVCRRNL